MLLKFSTSLVLIFAVYWCSANNPDFENDNEIAELLNATLSKLVDKNPSTETLDLDDIKKIRLPIVLKHLTSVFASGLGSLKNETAEQGLSFSDAQIDDLKKILMKFDQKSTPVVKKVATLQYLSFIADNVPEKKLLEFYEYFEFVGDKKTVA